MSGRMLIDPSATTVSLGKATLSVDPLTRKGELYVGSYQLKVMPYFFMSETGALELEVSEVTMQKILNGEPAAFTGKASNNKHGKPKVIAGEIRPSTKTQGNVTFSVETDNGLMTFDTTYHIGGS